jgi:hypothetical protein
MILAQNAHPCHLYSVFALTHSLCIRKYGIGTNTGSKYMRESDRKKFVDLASKRVSRAMKSIHLIGNLSNRSNYDYTDEDVTKIFRALQEELSSCKKRFEMASKGRADKKFLLE